MSDTETAPQGGDPGSEPAEAPAPAETGAATEPRVKPEGEADPTETTTEAPPKPSRADRRIAALSARLAAQSTELDTLRRAQASRGSAEPERPPAPEDLPRIVEERVAAEVARREIWQKVQAFHAAGQAAHSDWQERCQNLMQMGADDGLSELLIELPDGAKIAGALADDPEELERIAGIRTERGRAIALGKYAAAIEARPPPPKVSRAPAPIRPISGTARVEPNEHSMSSAQLVEYYSRQAMEARRAR